ncbi:response regulator [Luteimonas sp. 100069]|uniref:response regulator n=1 Tax=Luteimonas sp. 100069 TaxID=2006109 RepID=UPI000F4F7DF2|nr:response regulator [Luteimonas sp. 100069]RPD85412.1 response regulator [Luteimonas sp. 100069]
MSQHLLAAAVGPGGIDEEPTSMTLLSAPLLNRHILLVEDDYLIADALAEALRAIGAQVLGPVGNVEDALRSVSRLDGLEAVLLDVNLGGQCTFAVADAVQARRIPLVFVTAYARDLLPPRFSRVPHCLKPIDFDELAGVLAVQITG